MLFKNLLAITAGLLLSTVSASTNDTYEGIKSAIEARQQGCARGVHVIGIGGQGTQGGDLGLLAPLAYSIRDSIPRSTLSAISHDGLGGPEAINSGVNRLRSHITEYSNGCPNTKIVVAGYSIGAAISMNVFCGAAQDGNGALPNRFNRNILANVVYGDLTFTPGVNYHVGNCNAPGRVQRQRPGQCFPFGQKTRSYCLANDPECCSGNDPNIHFTYPARYDQQALNFVMRRWRNR